MSAKLEKIVVVIQQGKSQGGDAIVGRVKLDKNNTLGKIVFFKDLSEIDLTELDIGDEVEVTVLYEAEKFIHCVFLEENAVNRNIKGSNPIKQSEQVLPQTLGEIIHVQMKKTEKTHFNKTIYELTCINEVNDFLSDRAFKLFNTLVVKDQIVYVVHRVLE